MNEKKRITEIVYNICKDKLDKDINLNNLYFDWWMTRRSGDGLRLSEKGLQAFALAEIAYYDFHYKVENKQNFQSLALKFNKKIKCPFYLGFKNKSYQSAYIRLYDSRIATLVSLYGSIEEYIDSAKL